MQPHNAEVAGQHFLAKDVHVCASSGHVVFLDLKTGRYMTLQQRAARSLSRHVAGWPISEAMAGQTPSSPTDVRDLLSQLIRRGLLTTEVAASGRSAGPPSITPPKTTLLDSIHLQAPVILAHHMASFLVCSCRARAYLRLRGIQAVVERIRRRKAAMPVATERADLDSTRTLTAIFTRLQPLALDGRDGCLLQSFSLLEFLAHYGLFAHWVFAVRAIPFAAHCWLQQGDTVLNDVPQRAGYLSPILVI
jgi:hypothetical protein